MASSASFYGTYLARGVVMLQEGQPHLGVTVVKSVPLPRGGSLVASQGSVVSFEGDCIVNAANEGCLSGGGVDGAITSAGGQALAQARMALPELAPGIRCMTGNAVITIGGDLAAHHVVHAVGPNYYMFDNPEEADGKLYAAYAESMKRAEEAGVRTLAFSLISAGVFRGSRTVQEVLRIGIQAIRENSYDALREVHMVGFTSREVEELRELLNEACPGSH